MLAVAAARTAVLAALAACGRSPPSATFVGESTHFRLYVDPDLIVPSGLDGVNALDALETAWSDAHAMLRMPDGKRITYYWLTPDHIPAACGTPDEGACFWGSSFEIDSPTLPNPHELNHAYMYVRKQRTPIPFLAEGIAEAIGCGFQEPMNIDDVPWPAVVASPRSPAVYMQGGAFVRHLIRRFGVDDFLRYYEQSPEQRDPALYAANFASFFGTTMDDVWAELHDHPVNQAFTGETKICPCSLPPLAPSGPVANDPARTPYWTLPPLAGQTLALTAAQGGRVSIQDCAGLRLPMRGQGVLARLDDTVAPRFVLAPLEDATVGPYIADDCAGAAPYSIGPAFKSAAGLDIEIASPPSGAATVYLQLTTTFPWSLRGGLRGICDSCGFDPSTCPPWSASSPQTAQGTFYGKMQFYTSVSEPDADVLGTSITIQP
jgi:hypothetical protein